MIAYNGRSYKLYDSSLCINESIIFRGNGIGFGSMSARIGSIISPAIIELQTFGDWLPNTVFGILAIVGGIVSLWFRDTTGMEMMETIEEAEMFYNGKAPLKT